MSKDMVSKVLLSDEKIQHILTEGILKYAHLDIPDRRQSIDRDFCKAQFKAVIDYLEQPCTKHEIAMPYDSAIHIIAINDEPIYNHRRDCPECWNELKQEV